jgi:hypothetical protein
MKLTLRDTIYTILNVGVQLAETVPVNGSSVVLHHIANRDSQGVT